MKLSVMVEWVEEKSDETLSDFPKPMFNRWNDEIVDNLFLLRKKEALSGVSDWWNDKIKTKVVNNILKGE